MPRDPTARRLARNLKRAGMALVFESLVRALWPAATILAFFLAAAFFDLFILLPKLVHAAILLGLVVALWFALKRGFQGLHWPQEDAAMRRLEADSGLSHRPLTALADKMALGASDAQSQHLWQAHLDRLSGKLERLRPAQPRPALSLHDPRALRYLALLLLFCSLVVARSEWDARLATALDPNFNLSASNATRLDAWLDPPDYTGAPPKFLLEGAQPAATILSVQTAAGAKLVLRVHGGTRVPSATSNAPRGVRPQHFAAQSDGVFSLSYTLDRNGLVTVRQGAQTLARFNVQLAPDHPPEIAFTENVRVTPQQAIRLAYRVKDDFGVVAAELRMRRAQDRSHALVRVPLALPRQHIREAKLAQYLDLTANPWAGLKVEIELAAKDRLGQEATSARLMITLPERRFTNPLAIALIEQRKRLVKDPANAPDVADALDSLAAGQENDRGSASIYLGLRSAFWRLTERRDPAAISGTIDFLWQMAIALEEGDKNLAKTALEEARKDLMQALAEGKPESEIQNLVKNLKQALDAYLAQIAEAMQRAMSEGRLDNLPVDPDAQAVSRDDLQQLLDMVGELSRTGARGEAQELLSALDDILQNLSQGARGQPQPGSPESVANQALQDLGELIGKERGLLDETFRQHQSATAPAPAPSGQGTPSERLARKQDDLRRELGEILGQLGKTGIENPKALGRAERSMQAARDALGKGQLQRGVEGEQQALQALREGAMALSQAALEQMRRGMGAYARGAGSPGTDPFGRPNGGRGADFGDSVKVPDEMELRRARTILDEIERRASERGRPTDELDYLDRLLKRF